MPSSGSFPKLRGPSSLPFSYLFSPVAFFLFVLFPKSTLASPSLKPPCCFFFPVEKRISINDSISFSELQERCIWEEEVRKYHCCPLASCWKMSLFSISIPCHCVDLASLGPPYVAPSALSLLIEKVGMGKQPFVWAHPEYPSPLRSREWGGKQGEI